MIETAIIVVHIVVATFMILVVLVQGGNSGGMGAAFGGGNSSGVFGATGATTLLGKLTNGSAFIFMLTSLSLCVIEGKKGKIGLEKRLEKQSSETSGAEAPKADGDASGSKAK